MGSILRVTKSDDLRVVRFRCAQAELAGWLVCKEADSVQQLRESINNVVRRSAFILLPPLIGLEKNGFQAELLCAEDIAVHIITDKEDLFRPELHNLQGHGKKPL
ncbi:hypothetical protein VT99_12883, partial [Candidatus Electrothrix marina]